MAKNDVVKHDLFVGANFDLTADIEPIDFPPPRRRPSAEPSALVTAPTDTMITGQTLTAHPYRSVGKMFIQFDPLRTIGGSGWVVARKAFITAGHCVYWPPKTGWIFAATFCPRFNVECDKTYTVASVYTLQGWIDDQDDRQYDLAACVVTENFTDAEPPLAFETFALPSLNYAAIGYPGKPTPAHDFNGKRMWQSYGEFISLTNHVMEAANDLTGGSSGGPWVSGDADIAGGLTSYREDDPLVARSPYFGQGFQNLYDAVKDF